MSVLLNLARLIRHAPGLRSAEGLWRCARGPFHRLLDPRGKGVLVELAHQRRIRLPADLTGRFAGWKNYEPESVEQMARWIERHPEGLVLDLGCAVGMFTALALHTSRHVDVIAFDADVASLQVTRQVSGVAREPSRLRLVHGLISDQHRTGGVLAAAIHSTHQTLAANARPDATEATRYICIEDPGRAQLPEYTLDGLFSEAQATRRPTLLKCDVEGAEALVLAGARAWLAAVRPTMLLSVHPPALTKLGHSVAAVEALLREADYDWEVIGRDHEEHWWAEPRAAAAPRT